MELEKQIRGIYGCTRCGVCVHKYNPWGTKRVCPIREHTVGFEPYASRGRNQMAKGVLEGTIEVTPELAEVAYTCLLCGNCRQACGALDMTNNMQPLIVQPHIMKALRADLFASGVQLPEAVSMFSNAIERAQNIFGAPKEERNDWLTPDIKLDASADTIYFPGCLSTYREIEVAQAVAKVLNILDIPFTTLGEEEQCCGNPMLMVGNLFLARDLMRHNCELMKGKKVITSCAGCYRTLIEEYPKLLGEDCTMDATHIVKVLAEQVDQGKVKFTKEIKEKVVYHDPCELGRDMQVYDEPRKILAAIPGLEIVEFERTREQTWCCGGGGGVKGVNYNLSVEIAGDKVEQANEVGATMIISACPSCKTNINDGIKAAKSDLKMKDLMELVIEAGITKA
ncbi:(Fe-S)-binding protein [Chloroflexota bacterium]